MPPRWFLYWVLGWVWVCAIVGLLAWLQAYWEWKRDNRS